MAHPTIEKLPSDVIDQIAAGEVVERPSHLAKELIENSLDAGATVIEIEFSDGGRTLQVTDNGDGIRKGDLEKALDRHATSKIKKTDDLWKLATYGFRGEALASIAAVSELSLSSKTAEDLVGYQIDSSFGNRSSIEKVGGTQGTRVHVRNLFGNVPARLKFMKSASSEGTQIKNVVKAMALAFHHVEFRLVQEKELILVYPKAENRKQRAEQVLEVSPLYVGEATREGVTCFSVFADPHQVAKTSKNIWLFAQNRWIQDRGLQAAVMEAYRNLLMHGEFPYCVSWVETAPENIDVNIHPTKSQVKFLDASLAFRAVQASVRDTLEKAPWVPAGVNRQEMNVVSAQPEIESLSLASLALDSSFERTQFQKKEWNLQETTRAYQESRREVSPSVDFTRTPELVERTRGYWSQLEVLAQANLTYILTQGSEGLVFVDQHAAHERVMFERLMKAWHGGKIEAQEYLFPLAIDLAPDKVEAIVATADSLRKLGIEIEQLGPGTLGIRSAPLMLKEKALVQALEKMAHEIVDLGGSFSVEKQVTDLVATMACHSAIRAGQSLSAEEMQSLLESMDEFPLSSFCPHGRPVSVKYSFLQLEKDFGRLV